MLVKSFSYIDNALTDLRLCFTTTNAKRVGLARQVPKMEKPAQSAHYMSITHIKQQRLVSNAHYNLLRMLWGSVARENCTCRKEFYSLNVSWPACKPCPEFSNCDGGWKTPRPEAGFWRTPLCSRRTQCVNAFLKCKPNVACPGLDSNECLEGYTGRICGQCATGYYKRNQYCRKCPVGSERTTFKEQMDPFTNIVFAGLSYLLTLVIQVVFSRNRKDMSKSMLQTRTIVVVIYSVVMVIGLASIFSRIQVNFHGLFTYQILAVCLVLFFVLQLYTLHG